MSHTTHRPRHARPTRRTSRYLLAFASAAFISGAIAVPASAATAPAAPSAVAGVLSDIPGTNDDTTEYGGYTGPSDTGGILRGGSGGKGGNDDTTEYGGNTGANPYRDPVGGAYGPDTCLQGYVWRESYDGDTQCVTPAERDVAKAGGN
ncbi:hypothetical protein ACF059_31365 [Streptomyces sp. NPDC016562]|uniref:hypothetical protein n=1 Tax=Streptomyces sp. NPDC016562 TaxID=3364966 RepID=UPI003702DB4F